MLKSTFKVILGVGGVVALTAVSMKVFKTVERKQLEELQKDNLEKDNEISTLKKDVESLRTTYQKNIEKIKNDSLKENELLKKENEAFEGDLSKLRDQNVQLRQTLSSVLKTPEVNNLLTPRTKRTSAEITEDSSFEYL